LTSEAKENVKFLTTL
jgi:dynein heavy chain